MNRRPLRAILLVAYALARAVSPAHAAGDPYAEPGAAYKAEMKRDELPNLNTRFRQDQKTSLLHMLPPGTVVWVKDWQLLLDRLQVCFERAEVFASKLTALDSAELRDIFRDRAFLYPGEVQEALQERSVIHLGG